MTIQLFMEYLLLPVVIIMGGLLMCSNLGMNAVAGYRTRRSMSSPEMWAYAQKLCGMLWVVSGLLSFLLAGVMVLCTSYRPGEGIYGACFVVLLVVSLVFTELKLKAKEKELNQK